MQVAYTRTIMPSGLPPSPTLTNPDMILPYQPSPRNRWQQTSSSESSPETPRHMQQFENGSSTSVNESRPTGPDVPEAKRRLKPAGQSLSPFRNGVLSRPGGPARARSVTEREKVGDGRIRFENSRLSYRPIGTPEKLVASSPTLRDEYSSNRVIIIEDDEQSEAPSASVYAPDNTYKTPSILEEDEDNPNSHTAMSKRAEEILANAKKRLTNMEGNLNRARSTLGTRPSSSMSSFTNTRNNEPSSLYTLPSSRTNGHAFAKHRQTNSLDDSKGHSRGFSEDADGSPKEEGLGITNMDATDPGRQWFWNGLTRTTSLAQRERYNALQPLREDGPAPESFERSPSAMIPEEQDEDAAVDQGFDDLQKASNHFADFDSANPPTTGLTRARSTTQMRDIRDQMQDLKGKISTLKQRARQDSLYRRSLQNLRTPSPFTAAEQWYNGVPLHEERTASVSPQPNSTPRVESPLRGSPQEAPEESTTNGHLKMNELERDNDSGVDLHEQVHPVTTLVVISPTTEATAEPDIQPKAAALKSPAYDKSLPDLPAPDAEEVASLKETEVEDSLNGDVFHETSTLPVGERHEDRPDAFDYEHFFLHSGMGHHKTGRSRSSTQSSYSSIETTKPGETKVDLGRVNGNDVKKSHARKESVDSAASFTTAPSEERSSTDTDGEPTPKNVVIAPPRMDSLKHRKTNDVNVHKTRDPKRERLSKGAKKGTRPPSNSLSSPQATVLPQQDPERKVSLNSSSLLGYLSTLSPNSEQGEILLGDRDAELTERLFHSLAKVCADLEAIDPSEEGEGKYKARMYRRKLDAARRVLDGEVNGEAF